MRPEPTFKRIGIISRPRRSNIAEVVPPLLKWLEERGMPAVYDNETATVLKNENAGKTRHQVAQESDLLLVLGGDGTILAAAREAAYHGIPILPINMGSLGFLTSFTVEELYPALESTLAGKATIEERVLLQVERTHNGELLTQQRVLNDAVVHKGTLARMIEVELHINGAFVCRYRADGLIVASPTGSTAYSLSAGGPIVQPGVESILITPICPHTLTNRPLVIPNSARVEIEFRAGEESVFLTLDGQVGVELKPGDRVGVTKADSKLRLVRPTRKTYFEVLRNKLKWGER